MRAILKKWDSMPLVVKKAIIFLLVGWAAHYVFYFGLIAEDQPERVTYLQLGVGIGICYCVATIRKWARRLCIFFNIVMVPMYVLFTIAFTQGDKINLPSSPRSLRPLLVFHSIICLRKKPLSFSPRRKKKKSRKQMIRHASRNKGESESKASAAMHGR